MHREGLSNICRALRTELDKCKFTCIAYDFSEHFYGYGYFYGLPGMVLHGSSSK